MSSKAKKRLIIVLTIILLLIATGIIGINFLIDSLLNKTDKTDGFKPSEVHVVEPKPNTEDEIPDVVNVALFGVDLDDGGNPRSDVMKIISLNFDTRELHITSVQRDNLFYLPMKGRYEKLNHAYAYNGAQGAISALNYNLDFDITQYIKFDFDSIVYIVDYLGGVDISLSAAEAGQMRIGGAGTYHLNGTQALAYSRIRKIDSDYERMQRQNNVIDALLARIGDSSVTDIIGIINHVTPHIETNITNESFKNYATSYLTFSRTLKEYQFPSDGYSSILASLSLYGTGPHYVLRDFAGDVKLIHDHIYGGNYIISENVEKVDRETKELAGY